jgi:hypothetical protein
MTEEKPTLPPDVSVLSEQLNAAEAAIPKPEENIAAKIMIAVPNMVDINSMLVQKLFFYAMNPSYRVRFHILSEVRHHDHARNRIVEEFLRMADAQFLLMIDADVDTHPQLLDLAKLDKDVIAGNVFCWINGQLIPSIWQRGDCEQCRCLKIWQEEGKVHDPSQYRIRATDLGTCEGKGVLQRWNPFRQMYQDYATRESILEGQACRCQGTGRDPWVYQMHRDCIGRPDLIEVDSVGGAATMIARRVLEKMQLPWFSFLYKEIREMLLTEDHFFCWRAKLEGFQVWAHCQMACSHYKRIDLLQVNNVMVQAYNNGIETGKQISVASSPSPSGIILPTSKDISVLSRI